VLSEQVKAALHAREHAESQAIDLHKAKSVDIILIPFNDLTILHGGWLDGHEFVEPVMWEDETAGVLGEMTRRADQFAGQLHGETQTPIAEIEV
jgi:hypothetical protein